MIDRSGGDRDRSAKHLFCEQAGPFGRQGLRDLKFSLAEKRMQPPCCMLLYGSQEAPASVKKDFSDS